MNIRELQSALEYSREQLFQAKKRLDTATEPELIDAAIYEQMAWESRCSYYRRKLKEAGAGKICEMHGKQQIEYWRLVE